VNIGIEFRADLTVTLIATYSLEAKLEVEKWRTKIGGDRKEKMKGSESGINLKERR
jgi:hypothetical protein